MNRRPAIRTLDELPLFATDLEIAEAVVGPARAEHYARVTIKLLEKAPGFPPLNAAHGGRYTPAVRRFYDVEMGMASPSERLLAPDRPENPEAWRPSKRRA